MNAQLTLQHLIHCQVATLLTTSEQRGEIELYFVHHSKYDESTSGRYLV